MSQREVLEFLKEHDGSKFTSEQIAQHFNLAKASIVINLSKLTKFGLIIREIKGYRNYTYSYRG